MQFNSATIATLVIALVSIGGVVVFKGSDSIATIAYAACLALFTSSVFYSVTVLFPEEQRRVRIKNGLNKQYQSFKKRCIDLFLIAAKSQNYENRENLLDHREFCRYFSIELANDQSRWDLVETSIDDQDYIFDEIVREFEFFDREIEFARSSVEMNDEKVERFFINLRQRIHAIKASEANSDDYKEFCRTLWSIFTRWNFIEGQLEEDIIEKMIQEI